MASTQALLFCIWAYNCAADSWAAFTQGMNKLVTVVCNYFTGVTNRWYFLTGTNTPIPASYYQNTAYGLRMPHTVKWSYDTSTHTLIRHPFDLERTSEYQRFSWLSAAITAGYSSFALDNWIQNFTYEQSDNMWFNPRILAACWSIDSKIWFTSRDNAQLQIIDENGVLYTFPLTDEFDVEQWLLCLGDEEDGGEEDNGNDEVDDDENDEVDDGDENDENDEVDDGDVDEENDVDEGNEVDEENQPPVEEEQQQSPVEEQQPSAEEEHSSADAVPIPASPPSETVLEEID